MFSFLNPSTWQNWDSFGSFMEQAGAFTLTGLFSLRLLVLTPLILPFLALDKFCLKYGAYEKPWFSQSQDQHEDMRLLKGNQPEPVAEVVWKGGLAPALESALPSEGEWKGGDRNAPVDDSYNTS